MHEIGSETDLGSRCVGFTLVRQGARRVGVNIDDDRVPYCVEHLVDKIGERVGVRVEEATDEPALRVGVGFAQRGEL
ncbi:unannotated protein [freshwater metagenome]|uniref:Unannotated protein n=1 Tax=freshwater metagenome TaxID=449393 RepID=A0A6J7AXL4_9ZZZZ